MTLRGTEMRVAPVLVRIAWTALTIVACASRVSAQDHGAPAPKAAQAPTPKGTVQKREPAKAEEHHEAPAGTAKAGGSAPKQSAADRRRARQAARKAATAKAKADAAAASEQASAAASGAKAAPAKPGVVKVSPGAAAKAADAIKAALEAIPPPGAPGHKHVPGMPVPVIPARASRPAATPRRGSAGSAAAAATTPRVALQWPKERVVVTWPGVSDRVQLSWPKDLFAEPAPFWEADTP